MAIKHSLLLFFLRQTLPITLIGIPIAALYVLLWPEVMAWQDEWPVLFILIHSLIVTIFLGRFRTANFAFIYTRGYSRDSLWAHDMLASALSVLAVWLPATVIMWIGLRSIVQDHVFLSPYFPIMVPREASVPWVWLLIYAVIVPTFHYAWIRMAQPTRGSLSGNFVAVGLVLAMLSLIILDYRAGWFYWLIYAGCAVVIASTLAASRKLHQRLEVQA